MSGPVSHKTRHAVFERDGYRCQYCGVRCADENDLTVDHITPIKHGGEHKAWNLRTACRTCNCSKRDRSLEDFRFNRTLRDAGIGHILSTVQAAALIEAGIDLRLPKAHAFYFERASL